MSPYVRFPSMSTAALAHGDTVFIRALYPLGVLSANIYTGWILFMPLLKVVQNDISHADASEVRTTTISETFGTFNVIVTVMIIGPLSVIFVVRAHRTLCLRVLSERQRRIIFLVLIAAQYTLFVVLRYDALQGPVHYAFTGATFLLLYSYHISTTFVRVVGPALFKAKLIAGVTSATCIFCFLCFIVLWRVDEAPTLPWTATCLCEVLGAIALAALDITDLYVLRVSYDPWVRGHAWEEPALVYWRVMRRCLYFSVAVAVVLFFGWVLWVPLLGYLMPNGVPLPRNATTISHTFSTYNVLSTIFLIGPLTVFFMLHVYRIAFSQLLSPRHRRALILALVVFQYSLFIVLRADAITGSWHYIFTGLVFAVAYWYHLAVADAGLRRAKLPVVLLSALLVVLFGIYIFTDGTRDSWRWVAACLCELLGAGLIAVLESMDVLDFVTDKKHDADTARGQLLDALEHIPVKSNVPAPPQLPRALPKRPRSKRALTTAQEGEENFERALARAREREQQLWSSPSEEVPAQRFDLGFGARRKEEPPPPDLGKVQRNIFANDGEPWIPVQNFAAQSYRNMFGGKAEPSVIPWQDFAPPRQDFFAQETKLDAMPLQNFAAPRQDFPDAMPPQNFAAPRQDFFAQESKPDAIPVQNLAGPPETKIPARDSKPDMNAWKNFAAPRADFFAQESKPQATPLQNFAAQRQDFFVEDPKFNAMPLQNFSALQPPSFPPPTSRTETRNVYVPLAETGWQQKTLPGIVYETKDQNLPPVGPLETLASFWRGPET